MPKFLRRAVLLSGLILFFSSPSLTLADKTLSAHDNTPAPVKRGRIGNRRITESSGLAKSMRWPNVFWTHNDSGHPPRLFAIRRDGTTVPNRHTGSSGIIVVGAKSVDWEDIAIDDQGNLIIGDIGNNTSSRATLTLYRVREPDPFKACKTDPVEKQDIYFPDSPSRAWNCEALFWAGGKTYLLTKRRGGIKTGLYGVYGAPTQEVQSLVKIGSFDFGASVTAADASPDGRLLAVLTYNAVWLFEGTPGGNNYFNGKRSVFPFHIWQTEALCFDGDRILMTNERGQVFELDIRAGTPRR
jgi:hypothetical protein